MTPERWQQVKEIFHSALQYEPARRSAFLSRACGDEALRNEVESLIASHEKDGSFIDSPAYEAAAGLLVADETGLKPGQTLGPYEIISLLGRGGMGDVYLAKDNRLGRKVALKFLSAAFLNDPNRLQRFEREARAASALNQPNILTIHEIGEADGRRFIATEYIEGETLRQRMLIGPLTPAEALSIAEQVASALAAAHAAGIIHRDIKPDNIMLRRDGIVKVLDFGLAKLSEEKQTASEDVTHPLIKTSAGIVMGTVAYMSPEQARGLSVDARTDIWSLGVILYEMISGRAPFSGATTSDVLVSVLERNPAPIAIPGIPETIEFMIAKALTKERDERYQTAREILTDIRRMKQRLDATDESERSSPEFRQHLNQPGARTADELIGKTQTISSPTALARTGVVGKLRSHWLPATIALVFVTGGAFGIYLLLERLRAGSRPIASPTDVLRTTQISTRTGREIPALSPDGNSIAYSSRAENGAAEIFVNPLTPGAREIQITADGQGNFDPAWSPDGKLIAFRSAGRRGIWVIPATGGTARQLSDFGAVPAWSRDGSMIAFQSEPTEMPPTTIWTVPAKGGEAIQLTKAGNPSGGHSLPSWSPDGNRIVFASYWGATRGQLWTVRTKGEDLRQVTRKPIWFTSPVYSPDGEYIYASGVSETGSFGFYQLHISPTTGEALGEPVIVRDTGLARIAGRLTIAADGKKLAYNARTQTGDLISLPISKSGDATGPPTPLIRTTSYRKGVPIFSRDGRKLAFVNFNAGENQKIWIVDADGSKLTQLTTGSNMDWSASWFPDNDTIAFLRDDAGRQTIHSVSISTSRDKLLLGPQLEVGWPRLSPDGKQIAFNSTKGSTINTWIASVDGDPPRQLTFDSDQLGWPCWSPDGKLLALGLKRGASNHLAIMPSTGGPVTQLTFEPGQTQPYDWSPDGDKIVFSGLRNGVWNVYWFSRSTKQQKQLTHYTKETHYVRYPTWSPLGNQIVFEYSETTGSIWLMELK